MNNSLPAGSHKHRFTWYVAANVVSETIQGEDVGVMSSLVANPDDVPTDLSFRLS